MFSKALAAFVVVPFLTQSAIAATCARTYTVVSGDTCDGISAMQKVSTYQLAMVNPSIDQACDNLMPGQTLCLGNVGEDCQTTYVVARDDDCDKIVAATGTNSTLLYLNNPQINPICSNIYVGEVLCVATSRQSPAAPPASAMPAAAIPAGAVPANATPSQSSPSPVQNSPGPSSPASSSPAPAQSPPTPSSSAGSGSTPSSTSPPTVVTASPGDPDFDTLPFCDEL